MEEGGPGHWGHAMEESVLPLPPTSLPPVPGLQEVGSLAVPPEPGHDALPQLKPSVMEPWTEVPETMIQNKRFLL